MQTKFTKIVATVGPSSRDYETIYNLMQTGTDVFRLNFSHGIHADHKLSVDLIRKACRKTKKHAAIFQDLQGPKIRVGQIENDKIELIEGKEFIITTKPMIGKENRVSIDYPSLHMEAKPGNRILLDDGLLELEVKKIQGQEIITAVINGGILKPRKGVNLPHIDLKNLSAITEKDRKDLSFAFEHNLDYVALSFVRNPGDIRELRELMQKEYKATLPIIAKIEKPEAMVHLEEIIQEADAVMVARGDLGVETSAEDVPVMQKQIIRLCNRLGKPVITATQMLESMIQNPRPTRAEANDVANAILDGTDAVMLSGETAAGKYPVETVDTMRKICLKMESSVSFQRAIFKNHINKQEMIQGLDLGDALASKTKDPAEAVGFAAINLAHQMDSRYIVCFTHSGGTANMISRFRPDMPIVAFSPLLTTVRKLSLVWGVISLEISEVSSVDDLLEGAAYALQYENMVEEGDSIVITAGVPVGKPGKTNMIKVVTIEK